MGRGRKRRKKKWKMAGLTFLFFLLFLAVGALIAFKVFTVEKLEVTGSERYSDEVIEEWLLDDEHSWNSLYVYFKYKFQEPKELAFVDSMELSLKSPHILKVNVQEKALLGRVYIDTMGQNAYFDKNGIVVEMSSEVIKNVPKINGLDVKQIVLNEKLPIKGKSVLKNLLALTQALKKYKLIPGSIKYGEEGNYTLKYGKISVNLGQAENFNEKILRLSYIMPKLEGEQGVLHLESWTENTTDITFEKLK
ncbi:MAG: cell division protein FtsQ [Lachnospiraceae bacterium]|nr:cell division protein FtsQ [Lachnospiraceae bacterium]